MPTSSDFIFTLESDHEGELEDTLGRSEELDEDMSNRMRSAKDWKKEKVTTDKKTSKRPVAFDDELGGLNPNFTFELGGGQELWGILTAEKDEVKIGSRPVSLRQSVEESACR